MKKCFCLSFIIGFYLAMPALKAQKAQISLTFSGLNNTQYTMIDSVRVSNITFGCDTLVSYPDSVLTIELPTGNGNIPLIMSGFRIGLTGFEQGKSYMGLWIPAAGLVDMAAIDISGRYLFRDQRLLEAGYHTFAITTGQSGIVMFTTSMDNQQISVKLPSMPCGRNKTCKVEYVGYEGIFPALKTHPFDLGFCYHQGDKLIFSAYSGLLKSALWDSPVVNKSFTFQFAGNIPCIDEPEITYDGQVYHAVQIGSQCWMKENLNAGVMIPVSQQQTDNGIVEKYCYDDNPDNCITYGGLYQWHEAMQYNYTEGGQCMCPPGWHLATDLDWIILEGVADSQVDPGDPVWFGEGARGTDAGYKLRSSSTWDSPGGTDIFGFSALAAGFTYYGLSANKGAFAHFWTSSPSGSPWNPWMHWMRHDYSNPGRDYFLDENGRSLRCIRNQ
ncbi:MAG: FISUMP domain-containing protein [Lentimicrobium sp.]